MNGSRRKWEQSKLPRSHQFIRIVFLFVVKNTVLYMNGCDALWMAKWVAVHHHGDLTLCGYLAALNAHVESLAYLLYGNW